MAQFCGAIWLFGTSQQPSSVFIGCLAPARPLSKSPVGNSHCAGGGIKVQASFLLCGATFRGLGFGFWTTSSKESGESGSQDWFAFRPPSMTTKWISSANLVKVCWESWAGPAPRKDAAKAIVVPVPSNESQPAAVLCYAVRYSGVLLGKMGMSHLVVQIVLIHSGSIMRQKRPIWGWTRDRSARGRRKVATEGPGVGSAGP